jgi:hypothetical protein
VRDLVGAADVDTMAARDLLKSQTRLLSTLREIQDGMSKALGEQGEVLAVNELQGRVSRMDHSVIDVSVPLEPGAYW